MHIDAASEVHILGYITVEEAASLQQAQAELDLMLYPEPFADATQLVSVGRKQIVSRKAPAKDNGNPLRLKLEPVKSLLS
ncbi:MAG: hypothetical protein HY231_25715 [Acidobacteria bacterium]|nr:hypothetical protein [Acidobacteriota bacterium]